MSTLQFGQRENYMPTISLSKGLISAFIPGAKVNDLKPSF